MYDCVNALVFFPSAQQVDITGNDNGRSNNILTAWSENEAILRRRGGDLREWKDPKLFDPYKEERSFATHVQESSTTAGLLRVNTPKPDVDCTDFGPYSPAATHCGAVTQSGGRDPLRPDPDYFRHVTPATPNRGDEWDGSGLMVPTSELLVEMHPDLGACKPMRMRIPLHLLLIASIG